MWQSPFQALPAHNQQVWIRVNTVYGELAVATYSSIQRQFRTDVTQVIIPEYVVARWKPYP